MEFAPPPPPAQQPVSVVIVEANDVARAGLSTLLAGDPRLQVTGVFERPSDALDHLTAGQATDGPRVPPDTAVVLVDVLHEEIAAGGMLEALVATGAAVAGHSSFRSPTDVLPALSAGVRGLISRAASADLLRSALCTIGLGGYVIDDAVQRCLPALPVHRAEPLDQPVAALSPRERQVLNLFAAGHDEGSASDVLQLSRSTISSHLHHVRSKLNVHTAFQLGVLVERYRLLDGQVAPPV